MPNKNIRACMACKYGRLGSLRMSVEYKLQTWPRYMKTIINVLNNIYYVYIDQYSTDPFNIIYYYHGPRNNIVSLNCYIL